MPARDPDVETDSKSNDNNTDSANIAKILTKLDTLDDKIESTKIHLSERIEGSNAKAEETAKECAKVKVATTGLKQQLSVHGTRLGDLEAKIEQLERERRKTSLLIDRVKEQEDEDVATTVADIFRDLGVDYGTRVCINIYRRGRKQNADRRGQGAVKVRPRPIVVVFLRHNEKSQFFTHLKNLKGKEQWQNVYFKMI